MNNNNSTSLDEFKELCISSGGCGSKLEPSKLNILLDFILKNRTDKSCKLISDYDDVGYFPISKGMLVVQSIDFTKPIGGDPYKFGQIAAVNSLNDIYAKGAIPISALNICTIPEELNSLDIVLKMYEGSLSVFEETQTTLLGGHTLKNESLIFGFSLTGLVNKENIILNSNAQLGDVILLTKKIGTGVAISAFKNNLISEQDFSEFTDQMININLKLMSTLAEFKLNACTDVSGFGLIGHVYEMAKASNVSCLIDTKEIPYFESALSLINMGVETVNTSKIYEYLKKEIYFSNSVSEAFIKLLCDPQTSGGLLISINEKDASHLLQQLKKNEDVSSKIIGKVESRGDYRIYCK